MEEAENRRQVKIMVRVTFISPWSSTWRTFMGLAAEESGVGSEVRKKQVWAFLTISLIFLTAWSARRS